MKKKWLSLLLAMTMVLSLVTPAAFAADEETPVTPYTVPADVKGKLVVIHTNDTHGHDVAKEGETVGTAGVAALKKEFEAAGATVLLLSAGDFSQGTTLVSLDKGASAIDFMNAAGYDAASLGNHEFDYKMDALKANVAKAEFPILAANIVDAETKEPVFGDNTTFDTAIGKVGVFGLDTPETMTKAHPDNVKGLNFYQGDELVACAQAQVDELKASGCEFIIGLGHLGVDPESEPNRSTDILAKVTGVDLFVDGHSHTEMEGDSAKTVNSTLVVSTGQYLDNVGVVITDGTTTTSQLVSAAEYTKVDEAVAAVVNAKDAEVQEAMSASFGKTEVELNGERDPGNRTMETNLGDFACDALLWQAKQNLGEDKVDAALTNGGGIRATIPAGNITMNDMKTVFPFGNTVVTIDVTGAQLLEALEAATCSTPTAIGAFPQVAGITFSIDTSVKYAEGEQYPDSTYYAPAAPGSRVTISDVGGKGFDLEATYTIATNDFTAAGGDTYYVFKAGKNMTMTAVAMEDALINYTNEVLGGTITAERYAAPAGRITVKYIGVEPGAWYVDAAKYVMDKGLMSSTGNGFDASATVNRATVFQTLYNAEGKPANEKAASFTDVDGKWYADAAAWAETNGIATVGSDAMFNGDRAITRGEIAAILARYADYKKLYTGAEGTAITEMADYAALPEWAVDGMTVCYNNGILSGKPGNLLAAGDTAIRAELATMLKNFGALKTYHYDPAKPYDGVMSGLFNDVTITAGEAVGTATYYLPEGLQPWTPAVIVLTPDNTTAAAFAESETGMAWRAVADANKIGLTFLEPAEGKTWNLTLDKDGRDDAAVLNQLFMTMRSKGLSNVAPFSMDKSHTTLVGYQEGGAAALLFGGRNATDFSGIAAVDATAVPAESLKTVGEQLVLPFPGDSTVGVEEMHIQAKTVDMPVWFINSDKDNQAVVDYYVAANEAKKADANDYAETAYQAKDSDARVWVTSKEQTPETIYTQFLGTTKRFMAMQEGGRVSFANDFTKPEYKIHEEEVNGELRRWITYVPSTYTGKEDVPLVLVMHGYTASMYAIAEESRWYDVAEENGFIVVFAQGLVRPADAMGNIPAAIWCAGAFSSVLPGVDPMVDVNFINALLDKTEADYKIDASRVYATGHSNGSMMTWELGVQATERFAAIAPIGAMVAPTTDISSEALLPTWSMLGEFDSAGTVDLVEGNATVTALQAWNAHNGVNESKVTDSKQYDGQWETMTFANVAGVPLVRFTNVLGTPHVYLQEQAATLWSDFFSKYSRGEDGKLFYEGKEVKADDYVASADWYTAAEK